VPASRVDGIDVSNYQPNIQEVLVQFDPDHVVVRLSTERYSMTTIAQDQIAATLAYGASVSGYVWAYWNIPALEQIRAALEVILPGTGLTMIWIDCEDDDGADPARVVAWLEVARGVIESAGYRMGIYTGRYWWQDRAGNSDQFADLPLWLADYDGNADLVLRHPFGGWTTLAGKQYTSEPIDLDVFSSEVT
jgi:GH25 family lysozyme M1 (1,4-beta-N-acetylmuramidase)